MNAALVQHETEKRRIDLILKLRECYGDVATVPLIWHHLVTHIEGREYNPSKVWQFSCDNTGMIFETLEAKLPPITPETCDHWQNLPEKPFFIIVPSNEIPSLYKRDHSPYKKGEEHENKRYLILSLVSQGEHAIKVSPVLLLSSFKRGEGYFDCDTEYYYSQNKRPNELQVKHIDKYLDRPLSLQDVQTLKNEESKEPEEKRSRIRIIPNGIAIVVSAFFEEFNDLLGALSFMKDMSYCTTRSGIFHNGEVPEDMDFLINAYEHWISRGEAGGLMPVIKKPVSKEEAVKIFDGFVGRLKDYTKNKEKEIDPETYYEIMSLRS